MTHYFEFRAYNTESDIMKYTVWEVTVSGRTYDGAVYTDAALYDVFKDAFYASKRGEERFKENGFDEVQSKIEGRRVN